MTLLFRVNILTCGYLLAPYYALFTVTMLGTGYGIYDLVLVCSLEFLCSGQLTDMTFAGKAQIRQLNSRLKIYVALEQYNHFHRVRRNSSVNVEATTSSRRDLQCLMCEPDRLVSYIKVSSFSPLVPA